MKLLYFYLLIFLSFKIYSQKISGVVLDNITKIPIEFANIKINTTDFGVQTNNNGSFSIEINSEVKSIQVSCVGYKNKIVEIGNSFVTNLGTVFIERDILELEEVTISKKKVEYSWNKFLKFKTNKTGYFAFQFGTENVSYISNPDKNLGKLNALILSLKKVKDHPKFCKKCKVDYITAYSIKFYKYDSKNEKPGEEIYFNELIVKPENKTYKYKIKVDSLNIDFPKEGICIGVETYNDKYRKPKTAGAFTAPSLNFTEYSIENETKSWIRYRNEDWTFKTNSFQSNQGKKRNGLIIDIEYKIQQ